MVEIISDAAEVRSTARQLAQERGYLDSERTEPDQNLRHVYELYYQYAEAVPRLRPHQVLALDCGEWEGVLKLGILTFASADCLSLLQWPQHLMGEVGIWFHS